MSKRNKDRWLSIYKATYSIYTEEAFFIHTIFYLLTRLMRPLFFIVLLLLYSCQNGQIKKYSADDSALPTSFAIKISKHWSRKIGQGANDHYLKLVPAINQNSIFVTDSAGKIRALSNKSGALLWKKNIGLPVSSGLSIDQDQLLIGSSEGDILALDPNTGKILWRSSVSSEVLTPPRQAADIIIVRTVDGKITALDASDGRWLWDYNSAIPTLTLRGTSPPVIADTYIIAGLDSGRLVVLELNTGKIVWEYTVAITAGYSELERLADIDAAPIVVGDIIYFATVQGQVIALNLAKADPLWTRKITSYTSLGIDDNRLYITDNEDHIWALDRFSGTPVWTQKELNAEQLTGPGVIGELIVVGDRDGHLYWLDKYIGKLIGHNKASSSPIITAPAVVDQTLYVYASDGEVSSYTYRSSAKQKDE